MGLLQIFVLFHSHRLDRYSSLLNLVLSDLYGIRAALVDLFKYSILVQLVFEALLSEDCVLQLIPLKSCLEVERAGVCSAQHYLERVDEPILARPPDGTFRLFPALWR